MRSRNIKPGFFKNEIIGGLPAFTRLLFIGLWCMADREGRLEDKPRKIWAELFPYDTGIDVNSMLNELQAERFINRYEVDGNKYISISHFVKHQDPHYREKASVIPPPSGEENKIAATSVTGTKRARILERDGYKCQQCGSIENLCIDHILPVTRGGDSSDENLQVLCLPCNTRKRNRISNNEPKSVYIRSDDEPKQSSNVPLIPDSLIPDSLIPDSLIPDSKPLAETDAKHLPRLKISFSFEDGTFSNINGQYRLWQEAYPAVDVDAELRKAAAWLVSNPRQRKSDYAKFLNNWLCRAQDKPAPITRYPSKSFQQMEEERGRAELQKFMSRIDV